MTNITEQKINDLGDFIYSLDYNLKWPEDTIQRAYGVSKEEMTRNALRYLYREITGKEMSEQDRS